MVLSPLDVELSAEMYTGTVDAHWWIFRHVLSWRAKGQNYTSLSLARLLPFYQ